MRAGAQAVRPLPEVLRVAVIGNPNTGKSTLFNALTGLRQKVANYPGVTVEKHVGRMPLDGRPCELVDLPGTYSLAAHSPDELVAVDVLTGRLPEGGPPDAVVVVVDATNLRRNLYLVTQVRELGVPCVVALTMTDLTAGRGVEVDVAGLGRRLGLPVVATVASRSRGLDELRAALCGVLRQPQPTALPAVPAVRRAAEELRRELGGHAAGIPTAVLERALVDAGGAAERRLVAAAGADWAARLERRRQLVGGGRPPAAVEAEARYGLIDVLLDGVERRQQVTTISDRIDRVVNRPLVGSLLFVATMGLVFQAVFAWAVPAMDAIDSAIGALGGVLTALLPAGAVASLLVDGVLAGVGAVLVFLPQILILFAWIIVLEDSGYMARAAFLVDRAMRACGLSGHSFIPMLSSCACAVPGIMAARVISDRRDRLATILAAPFMTCSARLPVYALLIAAFVPRRSLLWGLVNLQGLVLLALYLLGVAGAVTTALLLKRTVLKGPAPPFLMELPPYRWPRWRSVAVQLGERARAFVVRAGTVIFAVSLGVWALAYFPRPASVAAAFDAARSEARAELDGAGLQQRLDELGDLEAAAYLEQSFLGRSGRLLEPVFRPLGWDWRISAAVVASLPAREVVIAVLGTIYAVGDDAGATDRGLVDRLRAARWPDGRRVLDLPVALGIMVFFAFCLQCVSTMAVMRRETNSWRWPAAAWLGMTSLAWLAAFVTVHLARLVV